MRRSLWVVAIVLLLQILLTASPFIPATASLWHTGEPQRFYEVFAAFVGLQMILLTAAISLILLKESSDAKDRLESVAARLPGTIVKPLKDFEFYIHFRGAVEVADHSVRIAYLAPYPPDEVPSKERKKYDEEILHLMKVRPRVNFRRIVRQSSKNNAWVSELMVALAGKANVDIAVLADLGPEHVMPMALSVQLIDENKVWLVATGSHHTNRHFRDVYIENADVADAITEYYARLWSKSRVVLDHGNITEEGQKLIEGLNS